MYVDFVFSNMYSLFNCISLFINYFCIEWQTQQSTEGLNSLLYLIEAVAIR